MSSLNDIICICSNNEKQEMVYYHQDLAMNELIYENYLNSIRSKQKEVESMFNDSNESIIASISKNLDNNHENSKLLHQLKCESLYLNHMKFQVLQLKCQFYIFKILQQKLSEKQNIWQFHCAKVIQFNECMLKKFINDNGGKCGLEKYKCNVCSKCFCSNLELSKHERNHLSSKVFKCEKCQKRFNKKNHLLQHKCNIKLEKKE